MLSSIVQQSCINILREELICATGCTEPIAVAYAAAKLREILQALPDKIEAEISGNILKNVKSVVVPNTGGLKGIKAAVAAGIIAGNANRELEVIDDVPPSSIPEISKYIERTPIEIRCPETQRMLDIRLIGISGNDHAVVHIANSHTNIVCMEKNGTVLIKKESGNNSEDSLTDKSFLNPSVILEFAKTVVLSQVEEILQRQIDCNTAIAENGFAHNWGTNIGSLLMENCNGDICKEAAAWAAAGSDARMSGCDMPVVICSGSGNQGITSSMPVVRYAKHLKASREVLLRALIVSNLVTVYIKRGIGRLSAYCGAVCAGTGAAAGIAFMEGSDLLTISRTITNSVALLSGMVCDGAKPSCAGKIAMSVDAGLLAYNMAKRGDYFQSGDGIVGFDTDNTVDNIGILARQGMQQTDRVILGIMNR